MGGNGVGGLKGGGRGVGEGRGTRVPERWGRG